MGRALIAAIAGHQEFTTPDGPVVAVARAVEGDADDCRVARQAVFGHAGGNVGMVVLDANSRQPLARRPLQRVARGQVVGVKVVGHRRRLDTEQPLQVGHAVLKGQQRLVILQIADVVTQEGVVVAGQAEGVLQLCPRGQQRGPAPRQPHRIGRVPPRPAQGQCVAAAARSSFNARAVPLL